MVITLADDDARQYLLLRNAWDFNGSLLRRVYTPDFLDRLHTATRDDFDPYALCSSVEEPLADGGPWWLFCH